MYVVTAAEDPTMHVNRTGVAGKLSFLEILRYHARLACASEKSSTGRVQPGSRLRWSGKEAAVSP